MIGMDLRLAAVALSCCLLFLGPGGIWPVVSGQSRVTPLSTAEVEQVWVNTFDGPRAGANSSLISSVAVSPNDGSVVAVGTASGAYLGHTSTAAAYSGEALDAFVVKLTPSGSIVWVRWFATPQQDVIVAVSIDRDGNIYTAGHTYGSMPGTNSSTIGYSEVFVVSLTASGDQRWIRQFVSTVEENYAADIGVDMYGAIYVAWSSYDLTAAALTKLASNGSTLFIQRYSLGTFFNVNNFYTHGQCGLVVVNPIVNLSTDVTVVLAVMTTSASSWPWANFSNTGSQYTADIIVTRVSALTGVPIWSQLYQTSTEDDMADIAVDSTGMIWLAGSTLASMDGGTYVGSQNSNGFLSKLSFDGTKLFTVQYGAGTSEVYATALLFDGAGELYVASVNEQHSAQPMLDGLPTLFNGTGGYRGYTDPAILSKYNSDGVRLWSAPFDSYVPSHISFSPSVTLYSYCRL